jgi:molybdate transport system substrate-binding protein
MHAILAVRKGNPKQIHALGDLSRGDISLVQANPDAAAIGKLSRAWFQKTGVWDTFQAHTRVVKLTVNDVANDLKLGAADAGFIWDAQLTQYPELESVPIPGLDQITGHIAVSLLRCSKQSGEAQKFLRYITSAETGVKEFQRYGYRPAQPAAP